MNIIYEDKNILIINKPAGLVVHAGAGETGETLVDLILKKYPEIIKFCWPDPTRPGVIHRLDKDTSGLIMFAKTPGALNYMQKKIQEHDICKQYLTLALGPVKPECGEIKSEISRSNRDFRLKSSSIISFDKNSKTAISRYRVLKNYNLEESIISLVSVQIITGRTHQIRVQMKSQGWPIIGDQHYNTKISKKISKKLGLNRQFLHAFKLEFKYNNKIQNFECELPDDLQSVINNLN